MNKKILALTLFTVVMLTIPLIGTAQACRWRRRVITKTLTGTYYVYTEANPPVDMWGPYATVYPATYEPGDNINVVWKNLPQLWTGDIMGDGTYTGIWFWTDFQTPDNELKSYGIQVIKNAVVDGVGTGNLVIYAKDYSMRILWGTGDLRGIKGTGTAEAVTGSFGTIFDYTLEVKIRP